MPAAQKAPAAGTKNAIPTPNIDTKGATVPIFEQPQFDPRIYTIPYGANNGMLERGYMKWSTDAAVPGYGTYQAVMHFLFNPTTVAISSTGDMTDQTAANMYAGAGGQTNNLTLLQQNLSFSLLYDRTFELWGQYNNVGSANKALAGQTIDSPGQQGVNVDIRAIKQITGQLGQLGPGGGDANTKTPVLQQGVMVPIRTWLYFGSQTADFFFFGFLTGYNVTVTHWSQYMVPMRCAIDVTFGLLPNAATTDAPDKPTTPGTKSDTWWAAKALTAGAGPQDKTPNDVGPPVSPVQLGSASIWGT